MKSIYLKRLLRVSTSGLLATMSALCFALPFNIVPESPLPTSILSGQTLQAFYTVTNNTANQRNGNFVKYLPPNVSQVVNDPSVANLCGSSFNLSAAGSSAASCILELAITGPVSAADTNPQHHLFVCFPGGKTCAGTNYPLNVTVGTQAQYAYFANQGQGGGDLGSISICTLNSCVSFTDPTFNQPQDIVINNNGKSAYVLNFGNNTISTCNVNSQTGSLSGCTSTSNRLFSFTNGGLNLTNNYLYATNYLSNTVSTCAFLTDGTLGTCVNNSGFIRPRGRIGINLAGTMAYVPNYSTRVISVCPIQSNGTFGTCNSTFTDPSITAPLGAFVNPQGTILYVANINFSGSEPVSTVTLCPIGTNGQLSACTPNSVGTFSFNGFTVTNLVVSNSNIAYVPNNGFIPNNVSVCPLNDDGTFASCTAYTSQTLDYVDSAWILYSS